MAISKEFIVNLKGREYPVWAGVLNEAHKVGLVTLTTELVQMPHLDNGETAVVKATATFADGKVFSDYGDCSPRSTSPMLAAACIRLASTRAKGRVLRDAVNVGQTLLEELADTDDTPEPARPRERQQQPARTPAKAPASPATAPVAAASPHSAELRERWLRLKREAEEVGVSVEPFRPTKDTPAQNVEKLLHALEALIGEVRERQQSAEEQEKAA